MAPSSLQSPFSLTAPAAGTVRQGVCRLSPGLGPSPVQKAVLHSLRCFGCSTLVPDLPYIQEFLFPREMERFPKTHLLSICVSHRTEWFLDGVFLEANG